MRKKSIEHLLGSIFSNRFLQESKQILNTKHLIPRHVRVSKLLNDKL